MKEFFLAKWRTYPKWLFVVSIFIFILLSNHRIDLATSSVSYFEYVFLQTNGFQMISFLLLSFFLPLCYIYIPGEETAIEKTWLENKQYLRWIGSYVLFAMILSICMIILYSLCTLLVYMLCFGARATYFTNAINPILQSQNYLFNGSFYLSFFVNMLCITLFSVTISLFVMVINILIKKSWGIALPCTLVYLLYQFRMSMLTSFTAENYMTTLLHKPLGVIIWTSLILLSVYCLYGIVRRYQFNQSYFKPKLVSRIRSISCICIPVALIGITYYIHYRLNLLQGGYSLFAGINLFQAMALPFPNVYIFNDMGSLMVVISCLPILDSITKNKSLKPHKQVLKPMIQCGITGGSIFIMAQLLLLIGCIIYSGRLFLSVPMELYLFRDYTTTSWIIGFFMLFVNSILYGFLFGALAYMVTRYLKPPLRSTIIILFPMFELIRPYIQSLFHNSYISLFFPTKMIELPCGIYLWQRVLNFGEFIVIISILYLIYVRKAQKSKI